ncbi:MBL fold metallo-hydrolase [Pseudoflavonifractor phocaeensis]|uniref:MBL fold metallo-hydrolase n=1 Tax=Pseudoflavonifractor phocaeensis TaxID=1870988 RepID=UPI00195B0884|nr:MBL fold metallo-hydrolase [Pseudoflavonifractor phocaeensis]
MLELYTLASGSSGNCLLVSSGSTRVLVDTGISCRRITTALRGLGVDPASLSAVLITHEHTDHMAGLATLTKQYRLPVYASRGTGLRLCYRIPFLEDLFNPIQPGQCFQVGELEIESYPTPHDAAQSTGYALSAEGRKAAVVTDLGHVTQAVAEGIRGAHLVVAEANHDVEWLRSGPYPYFLQDRILGDYGHLSNEAGAQLVCSAVEQGAHTVVLAHLSHENNTPERARQVVGDALTRMGALPGRDVTLEVAPRSEPSRRYVV